jgi:5-formyltetrahydrofolate cyclo-ligase
VTNLQGQYLPIGSCPCHTLGYGTWRPPRPTGLGRLDANRPARRHLTTVGKLFLNFAHQIKMQKSSLRSSARLRRKVLAKDIGKYFGTKLIEIFDTYFATGDDKTVAGYWPIGNEADVKPLLIKLNKVGCTCLLPVVVAVNEGLIFREWRPEDNLILSGMGVLEPAAHRLKGEPNILLVPLLAFDKQGYRLGYGGGYYDRTLKILRSKAKDKNQKLEVIGVSYADQLVESVPHDEFDQRIDWVITEEGLVQF